MKKSGISIYTKKYEKFRGVDLSTDPALVADGRSPWAPNMISDNGGMPEKRLGWRCLAQMQGRINGIYSIVIAGTRHMLAHAGTAIYRWYEDGTAPVQLYTGAPDERSTAVYLNGYLWIFTGAQLLRYDGSTCVTAQSIAYVPLTVIASSPAGGGTVYESVNYLTGKQRVRFLADGTSTEYRLPYASVDSVEKVTVNGAEMLSGWTARPNEGKVIFDTAPPAPIVGGADNVEISFTRNVTGYADRISRCTVAAVWGAGGAFDRIVATGNGVQKNQDYICQIADPTYWPDLNYAVVGTGETAIMGYRRWGEYLAIIKENNGQDSTIFLRAGTISAAGAVKFSVTPCLSGAGAVTRFGFGNIGDEQLILTANGVYAMTNNSITCEKIVQGRSYYIDPRLKEENLQDAVCVSYKKRFMIFTGGHVYILDGAQQKSYPSRNDTAFLYECFYWTGVPARCAAKTVEEGMETLYFGTGDGMLCRFNTDMQLLNKYADSHPAEFTDPGTLTEELYTFVYDGSVWLLNGEAADPAAFGLTAPAGAGETDELLLVKAENTYTATYRRAISAEWSTKADDDGDPMIYKTLLKKGNAVTVKPYYRSGGKIYFRTDYDAANWKVREEKKDILNWEDIRFERFTFNTNDAPSEILFNRKVKNYKRLQIIIRNDSIDEGFGVFAVTKHFIKGNFAKR